MKHNRLNHLIPPGVDPRLGVVPLVLFDRQANVIFVCGNSRKGSETDFTQFRKGEVMRVWEELGYNLSTDSDARDHTYFAVTQALDLPGVLMNYLNVPREVIGEPGQISNLPATVRYLSDVANRTNNEYREDIWDHRRKLLPHEDVSDVLIV